MTVAVQTSKAGPYTGDGNTTEFPYTFPVVDLRTVKVYVDGVLRETGVTITERKVIFDNAPANGTQVVVLREVPITQTTDIQNNTAFYPEIMEKAFDKLTMICQQLAEELERCIKVAPGLNDDGSLAETIGRLAGMVDDALRAAAEAAAILAQIRELLERSKLLGNYIIVNGTDENGYLICDKDSLPYAVTTNTGKVFPLEKGSVTETEEAYLVDTKPYLAYMNQAAFEGPWLVWRTGGQKGDPGEPGTPGEPGKSAYDIAVENGFEGTEAEWLDTLRGYATDAVNSHNTSAVAHENQFSRYVRSTGGTVSGSLNVTGTLTVGGKEVSPGVGFPDYRKGTDVTTSVNSPSGWTADKNGWLLLRHVPNIPVRVLVNGADAWGSCNVAGGGYDMSMIPVANGDTVTRMPAEQGYGDVTSAVFYPCK